MVVVVLSLGLMQSLLGAILKIEKAAPLFPSP
jgi:hypothetical protein